MTFSIIGHCRKSGAFGAAITTSNLAVGGRCVRLLHERGAFLSQHRTDPRLGDLGIRLIEAGVAAGDAVARVASSTPDAEWRQLGALDADGNVGVFHGREMYSIFGHAVAPGCLALGNILGSDEVVGAMAQAFEAADGEPLGERLMRALEAGRDNGSEIKGPLRSAALRVTGPEGMDACDLRIDISEAAVADLRSLWNAYGDEGRHLLAVALEPASRPLIPPLVEASRARIAELDLRTALDRRFGLWSGSAQQPIEKR